jgi:hypothetical protein
MYRYSTFPFWHMQFQQKMVRNSGRQCFEDGVSLPHSSDVRHSCCTLAHTTITLAHTTIAHSVHSAHTLTYAGHSVHSALTLVAHLTPGAHCVHSCPHTRAAHSFVSTGGGSVAATWTWLSSFRAGATSIQSHCSRSTHRLPESCMAAR